MLLRIMALEMKWSATFKAAVFCVIVYCILRATTNTSRETSSAKHEIIQNIERFVFFIGYARSGHSAIASLMDGHPDMIIAHEFRVFERIAQNNLSIDTRSGLYTMLYQNSQRAREGKGSRSKQQDSKGYTLHLPDESWQGRFRTLRVIGDKAGGNTVDTFIRNETRFAEAYLKLVGIVKVPIRVIHVVRNPFDMVATEVLFSASNTYLKKLSNVSEEWRFGNQRMISSRADVLFRRATAIAKMIKTFNFSLLEVHLEEFIGNPRRELNRICSFLQLKCGEDYLKICEEKAYKSLSHSSKLIEWSQPHKSYMKNKLQSYPWFGEYL